MYTICYSVEISLHSIECVTPVGSHDYEGYDLYFEFYCFSVAIKARPCLSLHLYIAWVLEANVTSLSLSDLFIMTRLLHTVTSFYVCYNNHTGTKERSQHLRP